MRNVVLDQVGSLVRQERLRRGMTQTELAERIGVTRQTVARMERDASDTTVATLASALRALDVQLHASREDSDHAHTAVAAPPDRAAALALARLAPQLPDLLSESITSHLPEGSQRELARVFDSLPQFPLPSDTLADLREQLRALTAPVDRHVARELTETVQEMRRAVLALSEAQR